MVNRQRQEFPVEHLEQKHVDLTLPFPNDSSFFYGGDKAGNAFITRMAFRGPDRPHEYWFDFYLQGKGYFDARWPLPEGRRLSGYALYDAAIHAAARLVGRRMPVRLDAREALFGPGECDHAALYCGWYSLGRYIDSFIWSKGAIGYHIASSECTTLKDTSSQVWCLKMLEKGAVATIGPVYEPYVEGFPLPDIFFGHLVEGAMSLGECYLISLPYLSWQMVLIGDPMYQPFRPPSSR